jgi:hypothetical protein
MTAMHSTSTSAPTRKQAAVTAVVFGLLCLSFGFSLCKFLQKAPTTLNVFGTSCGGLSVLIIGMVTVLQILKSR